MKASQHLPVSGGRALRVCHLGKFYPPAPGGIESHVRALARAQAALGAEVEVVCVNHLTEAGTDLTWRPWLRSVDSEEWDESVRVIRLGRVLGFSRLELCPSLSRVLRQRMRWADVVHVHAPNVTMYLGLLAQRLRVPLVVTHHSDIVKQRHLAVAFGPVERHTLRRASLVLATSDGYAAGSDTLSAHTAKVRVLPLGLPLEPYLQPGPKAYAFRDALTAEYGGPLWLFVGRLTYYKGLHIAIAALKHVPGKLMLVGKGPLEKAISKLADGLGVSDRLVWREYLEPEELVGAYLAATALWLPSTARGEGFGLVQVEAMAAGCPVINTSLPGSGVSWVSQHEVSGLTVPPGDEFALAAAAHRFLADDALRQRLSQGACRRAQAEFGDDTMARRSLKYYEALLNSRS